ncbi:MAG: MFS transporter, partial [Actinobacteria bacterium]|nr:MFS transporter [Actinomycetota bacterium]
MPRAARIAVTAVFFASGAAYGSFVARIPALKEKLEAGEAELGLVLFAGAVGAILVLPLAGWLSARVGSRRVTRASLLAVGLCLPLLALAPTLLTFALVFALFGAVTSALDLGMNAHGVEVEERYARPIFSSFHASWSLGGLAGAGVGGAAAALAVPPLAQFAGVGAVVLAILVWSAHGLLPHEGDAGARGRAFGRPSAALVALAALAFAGLVAEGAAADWSAVYLDDSVGTSEAVATAGFAAFAATMTLGRLVGDRLTAAWGPVLLTRRAGVLATAGMAAALLLGNSIGGVVGFACLGAGLATVIPSVFRAAGRRSASPGTGIAAVSSVGYSAFLVGPPAIGFLAEAIGL